MDAAAEENTLIVLKVFLYNINKMISLILNIFMANLSK